MAAKKKQLPIPTPPVQPQVVLRGDEKAITVDVLKSKDAWSEFTLADGTVIKAKPALIHVKKIMGKYNLDGKPIYQVQVGMALDTKVPARLMKKKKKE